MCPLIILLLADQLLHEVAMGGIIIIALVRSYNLGRVVTITLNQPLLPLLASHDRDLKP